MSEKLLQSEAPFKSTDIRTQASPSFRGDDVYFDPNKVVKIRDHNGVLQDVYPERSLTQQQFKDECDINSIVARADATGIYSHVASGSPMQGDFTEFGDATHFQNAKNLVIAAEASFNALPANVRARFNNDPASLIAFLEDDKNDLEAYKLGLLNSAPETQPEDVPDVSRGKKKPSEVPQE